MISRLECIKGELSSAKKEFFITRLNKFKAIPEMINFDYIYELRQIEEEEY
jgi:hypothetical protein